MSETWEVETDALPANALRHVANFTHRPIGGSVGEGGRLGTVCSYFGEQEAKGLATYLREQGYEAVATPPTRRG